MATSRRTEWSAAGRPLGPPVSYGGGPPPPPPSYETSPYPPSHRHAASYVDSPPHHGPPSSYSYARGYTGPQSSYESPAHYGYEREGLPPPRYHERGPPPPPPSYGAGGYEAYPPPPSSPYASPPPNRATSTFSNRGGRGPPGHRYLHARVPSSGDAKSISSASTSATGSPSRRSVASSTGGLPMIRQSLKPPGSNAPASWEPPRKDADDTATAAAGDNGAEKEGDKKEEGDPLALLAKVSSDMDGTSKSDKKKADSNPEGGAAATAAPESPATPKTTPASMAPPTSPLARRGMAHPADDVQRSPVITPNPSVTAVSWKRPRDDYSTTTSGSRRSVAGSSAGGPKPITPMPPHYMAGYDDRGPIPPPSHYHHGPPPPPSSSSYYSQGPPPPHGSGAYGGPPPGYESGPPPPHGSGAYAGPYAYPPHVVERHSFDSQESSSLTSQESWRRGPYPAGSGPPPSMPPPPPPHGHHHHYGGPPEGWYPPPTTPYPGREGHPPGGSYVSPYGPIPPPHHLHHHGPPPPPHMEEKTILRKKFSWKHYPELERFLIQNRDDYLEHSSKNYTAEQKQYNNWLTERLLEVADQHHYAFDPEDFNFVAIRDRIRCYYKSYVQTARKRGLELPGNAHLKRTKLSGSSQTDKKDAADDTATTTTVVTEEASVGKEPVLATTGDKEEPPSATAQE